MSMRISIVGMGVIGTLAARHLLEAEPDLALTVFDVEQDRCEEFRGRATLATSAHEALEESDTIVLALPRERDIDRTLERFSDGQVSAAIAGKLILDLEPPPRDRALSLDAAIAAAGGRYAIAKTPGTPALLAMTPASPPEARLLRALMRVAAAVEGFAH